MRGVGARERRKAKRALLRGKVLAERGRLMREHYVRATSTRAHNWRSKVRAETLLRATTRTARKGEQHDILLPSGKRLMVVRDAAVHIPYGLKDGYRKAVNARLRSFIERDIASVPHEKDTHAHSMECLSPLP